MQGILVTGLGVPSVTKLKKVNKLKKGERC